MAVAVIAGMMYMVVHHCASLIKYSDAISSVIFHSSSRFWQRRTCLSKLSLRVNFFSGMLHNGLGQ
jgi:high-affinity Fe2+/Pb2+ permease